jgi:hypothetical protein
MHTEQPTVQSTPAQAHPDFVGAAPYTGVVLPIYDFYVLKFNNGLVWRCPTRDILAFYNEHVANRHLDVGVGTGYFLDKCRFPSPHPVVSLIDFNPQCLAVSALRLRRYAPATYVANVLEPIVIDAPGFDSIGLNYVLHCLPRPMREKGVVFRHLIPLLNPGGVIFGTTILGRGVRHRLVARATMKSFNKIRTFTNDADSPGDLERVLQESFSSYSLQVRGCVAFFVGRP